jgi:hypothetical protein
MKQKEISMSSIIRKKKKTLFGRIIKKIESELTPREEKLISPYVPLDDNCDNGSDTADIQARRDELKSTGCNNSNQMILSFCEM